MLADAIGGADKRTEGLVVSKAVFHLGGNLLHERLHRDFSIRDAEVDLGVVIARVRGEESLLRSVAKASDGRHSNSLREHFS